MLTINLGLFWLCALPFVAVPIVTWLVRWWAALIVRVVSGRK